MWMSYKNSKHRDCSCVPIFLYNTCLAPYYEMYNNHNRKTQIGSLAGLSDVALACVEQENTEWTLQELKSCHLSPDNMPDSQETDCVIPLSFHFLPPPPRPTPALPSSAERRLKAAALCCRTSVKAPGWRRWRWWTTAALRCSTVRAKHQRAKHLPLITHTFAYTNTYTSSRASLNSRGRRPRSSRGPEIRALLCRYRVRQQTLCDVRARCRRQQGFSQPPCFLSRGNLQNRLMIRWIQNLK